MSEQLTADRLAELRRIAEAATPGPWEVSGPDYGSGDMQHATEVFAQDEYGTEFDICRAPGERDEAAESADMEYIAALDPATVLAMLDEIERLQRIESAARRVRATHPYDHSRVAGLCDCSLCELNAALDGEKGGGGNE